MAWTSVSAAIASIVVAVAALCLLSSCASYPNPSVADDPPAGIAIGIKQQLDRHDASAFRVVFVHGMGTHQPNYADAWIADELAPRLGLRRVGDKPDIVPIAISGFPDYAWPQLTIHRYVARDEVNNRDVDFQFAAITWSPLTTNYSARAHEYVAS